MLISVKKLVICGYKFIQQYIYVDYITRVYTKYFRMYDVRAPNVNQG